MVIKTCLNADEAVLSIGLVYLLFLSDLHFEGFMRLFVQTMEQ